jgi:hypothetical protein
MLSPQIQKGQDNSCPFSYLLSGLDRSATTETVSAVVAQITVSVSYRDRAAVIASRCVALESAELFAATILTDCRRGDRPTGTLVLVANEPSLSANRLSANRLSTV